LRQGVTLLELLVVIGITGVLLGLLVAAVMQIREAANIAQSKNNLRQIVIGVHNFGSAHRGRLPPAGNERAVILPNGNFVRHGTPAPSLFVQILPHVEAAAANRKGTFQPFPLFLSPSDPTLPQALAKKAPVSSYAVNGEAFRDAPRLAASFPDGTSNTIALAEHYSYDCSGIRFPYPQAGFEMGAVHRATFADVGDVLPFTQGDPPLTTRALRPEVPVATFQVAPRPDDCYWVVPQTPHPSGMLVALVDGGVRQLSPGMSPFTFWSAVTPASGDVLGSEW
jgi:prepilin-type N-terminal cleavage/methylation domain-containing protein